MSNRTFQFKSIVVRLLVGGAVVAAVMSPDASSLLWRNALILVPLTAVVALVIRLLPSRPVTRHSMWLALLVWPIAGLVLPPLNFGSGDDNPSVDGRHRHTVPEIIDGIGSIARAPHVTDQRPPSPVSIQERHTQASPPKRRHRVRERQGRFSILEATEAMSSTPLRPAPAERVPPAADASSEEGTKSDGSKLIDVDLLSLNAAPGVESEFTGGEFPAEPVPTPPMTVARTQGRTPSNLLSVFTWGGQLSQWTQEARTGLNTTIHSFNEILVAMADAARFDSPDSSAGVCLANAEAASPQSGLSTELSHDAPRPTQICENNSVGAPVIDDADTDLRLPTQSFDLHALSGFPGTRTQSSAAEIAAAAASSPGWRDTLLTAFTPWMASLRNLRDVVMGWPAIPVSAWVLGVVLIVAWRLEQARRFRRLIARSRRASVAIREQVAEAACAIGLAEPPRVALVREHISPLIWFEDVPTLILPERLWDELDEKGRKAVLFHELAHLKRRDHWVCRFDAWIGAIYWWHPVVWWIRNRLHDEAENCCDAWVTWLQPGGRRAYAEALIRTNQFVCGPKVAAPASSIGMTTGRTRRFARRLTMVMTQRVAPSFSGSTVAVAVGVLAAGWLATPAQSCDQDKNKPAEPARVLVTAPASPDAAPAVIVTSAVPSAAEPPMPVVIEVSDDALPAVATTSPLPVVAFSGVAPAIPTADMLPLLGLLHSDPAGDKEGSLEDRVRRLEERLARLTELLERQQGMRGPGAAATPVPPQHPRTPAPRGVGRAGSPAETPGAMGWTSRAGAEPRVADRRGVYGQVYPIPDGRRESLLKLMVRPDVPPRVREVDGGIEFNGTADQHAAFSAFAEMISGEMEETREYGLSKGKLEALTEFMSRDDVPVIIEPNDENLRVRGNAAVQRVMRNFINLIEPESGAMAPAAAGNNASTMARIEKELSHKQKAMELEVAARAHADASRAAEAAHAGHVQHLRRAAEELQREAERLEREADQLSDRADDLNDRASEMSESLEKMDGDQRKSIEAEMKALEKQARELERAAKKLYAQSAELERKGEEQEARADSIEESADAVEAHHAESAHNHAR